MARDVTAANCDSIYEDYIERHRRWNFFANAADLSAVNLANTFIFASTILTLYTSYLTSSAVLIGLIPAIQQVGYLLPQLLSARKAQKLSRKKPWVVKVSIIERIPYLFVTLGIFLIPGAPHWLAYGVLAVSIGIATGAAGVATPAWKAMLGKLIHPNRRGALFSTGMSLGGFLGVGGTFLIRWILKSYGYPDSFGLCFLLSFIFQAISWMFLTLNREPARIPANAQVPQWEYFRRLPALMKENRNFSLFLLASCLVIMSEMAGSFYIVFARFAFHISDSFAATLTLIALLSQSLGTPLLGVIGDKKGHKWLIEFSTVLGIAALVILLIIPSVGWIYGVFLLMSLSRAGLKIAQAAITMEFGTLDQMPTFVALAGTLLGIPTFLAPIVGGAILDGFGYTTLFVSALMIGLCGVFIFHIKVVDPRVSKEATSLIPKERQNSDMQ